MKQIYVILSLIAGLALNSCTFGKNYFLDFTQVDSADPSWFKVTAQRETEMDSQLRSELEERISKKIEEQEIGNQESVSRSNRRFTSSVPVSQVMQELLDWTHSGSVVELSGTYHSIDTKGKDVVLSGKVVLPKGKKIKRWIVVSHYTIGKNTEAPSNIFPLEAMICPDGFGMIFPDYIGYGVTRSMIHPYLAMDLTARNVLDMYKAVLPFMEAAGVKAESDSIYIMGYSQGGATTMAVQRLIEKEHPEIKIKRVFAGGGPYDVVATYDQFVTSNHASYPCAVPMVIQGMQVAAGLNLSMDSITTPLVYEHLDEWFNSKNYTTSEMNKLLGTYTTSDLISKKGLDRTSPEVALLYQAMYQNSMVFDYTWAPEAPVFMMHSMDDETVPYLNAQRAKNAWEYSNIEYNFGHYGGHVMTAVRFIMTVKGILAK